MKKTSKKPKAKKKMPKPVPKNGKARGLDGGRKPSIALEAALRAVEKMGRKK